MRIEKNVNELKAVVNAAAFFGDENKIGFEGNALSIKSLDESQIAMILLNDQKANYTVWEANGTPSIGINIKEFQKFLRSVKDKKARVELNVDEKGLAVYVNDNGIQKSAKLESIEVCSGPTRELQIDWQNTVKFRTKELLNILKPLKSNPLIIKIEVDKVTIQDAEGKLVSELKSGNVDLNVQRPGEICIHGEYAYGLCKSITGEETVLYIGFGTPEDRRPKPLKITGVCGTADVTYYLAPRIEND